MEDVIIEDKNQLRAAVVQLTAAVQEMCNSSETEAVVKNMVTAKEHLVAIYRYMIESTRS